MTIRYLIGLAVVALALALTKAWLSQPGPEEPAPSPGGGGISFDSLDPNIDQVMKWRADAQELQPAASQPR
jgi:hypothetical protein